MFDYIWSYLSITGLAFVGLLMIFIVLLQRGRGGGLAGAFGGAGGQSALGTKAGDVFTKITVVMAVVWVSLAGLASYAMRAESGGRFESNADEQAAASIGSTDDEESLEDIFATEGVGEAGSVEDEAEAGSTE
ncbi:MAG: preprotein translocase subunit SecG [Planctomycetota bacterium]